MKKIWLFAKMTYRQRVTSSMFLILTFAVPILSVIAGAIPFMMDRFGDDPSPVGFVDQTGRLAPGTDIQIEDTTIVVNTYDDVDAVSTAYEAGEIGGYLVVPPGYFDGEPPQYYAEEAPNDTLSSAMTIFMRQVLLPDTPDWTLDLLADPTDRTYVSLATDESMDDGPELILRIAVPVGMAILLGLALVFTSNQMGVAIVREKDQRAMEMVITSLRPTELVAGKVLGMSLLSLTQITIWAIGAVFAIGLLVAGEIEFASLSLPWVTFFWAFMLGVPGYFLYAVIASGLGILAGDSQQAQQWAGYLGIFGVVPLWFAAFLIDAPNSAAAIGLTLFPFTGPVVALIRMSFTEVPLWQLLVSFAILTASLAAGVWLVARLFRAAMLIYGKTLRPREIIRAMRQA